MPRKLTKIELTEVSVCRNPAMKGAKITIMKSDDKRKETSKMDEKEIAKMKEKLEELEKASKDHADALKKKDEEIAKLTKEKEALAKEKEETPADPAAPKVVYKAMDGSEYTEKDDPRLVSTVKRSDEMAKELAEKNLLEKAREHDYIPGTVEERALLIKSLDAIEDEKAREAAYANLKKQHEEVEKLTKTYGSNYDPKATEADKAKKEEIEKSLDKHANQGDITKAFIKTYGDEWTLGTRNLKGE